MNSRTEALIQLIAQATGTSGFSIESAQPCSGGCINRAEFVRLSDGRRFFVKSNRNALDMFTKEAEGLAAINAVRAIEVPEVVASGPLSGDESCLVLAAIVSTKPSSRFWPDFGHRFAKLHRESTASYFGWTSDNYVGATVQKNDASDDWVEFFADRRIAFQLRLARDRALGSEELFRLGGRLVDRLDRLIGGPQPISSLLHGDLWSGNYVIGKQGQPVLIDPAVYNGSREADLAMPLLFGGFPQVFFDAYDETWPLDAGWQDRVELYKLYHWLNHLNLFGVGYLDGCLKILRRFAN